MKLNFLTPDIKKSKTRDALIGKTGVIRFTNDFANNHKFLKNEFWLVGVDEEEKPLKSIYVLKTIEKNRGFKMQFFNGRWFIDCKDIIEKTKMKVPVECTGEFVKVNDLEGFQLLILLNTPPKKKLL